MSDDLCNYCKKPINDTAVCEFCGKEIVARHCSIDCWWQHPDNDDDLACPDPLPKGQQRIDFSIIKFVEVNPVPTQKELNL